MSFEQPRTGWRFSHVTTHPGEMLREELMTPYGLTRESLAARLHLPLEVIIELLEERRPLTADIAVRLSRLFGNSGQFWLNLQSTYDLSKAQCRDAELVDKLVKPLHEAAA